MGAAGSTPPGQRPSRRVLESLAGTVTDQDAAKATAGETSQQTAAGGGKRFQLGMGGAGRGPAKGFKL